MAKRAFKYSTWTPTVALDAVGLASQNYMAIQGGSSTQRIAISEVSGHGQASASGINAMVLSRDSTVGVTLTALTTAQSDAALDPATAALAAPAVPFVAASGTAPQRSATLGLLTCGFNAFGGVHRWVAYPGEEIWMLGNTASFGEVSYSAYGAATPGAMGSHIIYEPL